MAVPRRTLNEVAARWSTRQGDITAAVAGLAEAVARLALHIKLTVAVAHTTEVERAAQALRDAAECASGFIFKSDFGSEIHDAQATSIVTTFPKDDSNVCDLEGIEAEIAEPEGQHHEIEREIARGILNLHDRLGSFIKS